MGCHALLQGIFPTKGLNPCLLHSVQFFSVTQSCLTLCNPSWQHVRLCIPVHNQHPELAQTHVHRVSDAIQPYHPLSSPSPPAFSLSQHQGLFQWVKSSHQVVKVGASALVLVLPMNIQDWFPLWLSGLISLQSKGLSSLLQHHSSKTSILWHSSFFMFQLLHPYPTTGKTIALTRQTFVRKVMSLLFNMLSRFVIAVLEACIGMQVLLPLVPPWRPNYMCSQWFPALGKNYPGPCSLTEWKPTWKGRPSVV